MIGRIRSCIRSRLTGWGNLRFGLCFYRPGALRSQQQQGKDHLTLAHHGANVSQRIELDDVSSSACTKAANRQLFQRCSGLSLEPQFANSGYE